MKLSLSVVVIETDLTPEHPRWIGAWWMGFLICSIINFAICIPTSMIPKNLRPIRGSSSVAATTSNAKIDTGEEGEEKEEGEQKDKNEEDETKEKEEKEENGEQDREGEKEKEDEQKEKNEKEDEELEKQEKEGREEDQEMIKKEEDKGKDEKGKKKEQEGKEVKKIMEDVKKPFVPSTAEQESSTRPPKYLGDWKGNSKPDSVVSVNR